MKNLFSEYVPLEQVAFESLWQNCLFVFDTNVLLNFYRYSDASSLELSETINFYGDRVWIPYCVGHEFFEGRLGVIGEQIKNYSEAIRDLQRVKNTLANRKGHPFVTEKSFSEFDSIVKKIEEEFSEREGILSKLTTQDNIAKKVTELFENRVGQPYTVDVLNALYKEGVERYKSHKPPGYKDSSKPEPSRYGDLVIWKQVIDKAKQEQKPVLFISDDEKEDWILKSSGKTVGPLPELVREFLECTGQRFHIYSTFSFLKFSYDFRKRAVNQPILDEVQYIGNNAQKQGSETKDETHLITCDLNLNAGSSLNPIVDRLQSQGYYLNTDSIGINEARISVKVPFKDLVRRFHNHLQGLTGQYNFSIKNFSTVIV